MSNSVTIPSGQIVTPSTLGTDATGTLTTDYDGCTPATDSLTCNGELDLSAGITFAATASSGSGEVKLRGGGEFHALGSVASSLQFVFGPPGGIVKLDRLDLCDILVAKQLTGYSLGDSIIFRGLSTPHTQTDTLNKGDALWAGEFAFSHDGSHVLIMQKDGNLVLYNTGAYPSGSRYTAIWASNTYGNSGAYCSFQTDGNLVVYSSGGSPLWAAGCNGRGGNTCVVQYDGNLVIYDASNNPIWATGTNGR